MSELLNNVIKFVGSQKKTKENRMKQQQQTYNKKNEEEEERKREVRARVMMIDAIRKQIIINEDVDLVRRHNHSHKHT